MGFFSVEGPLYRFMTGLWDVVKLNILWLLFSLPIVTIGASTTAVFSVTNKMAEDAEGYVGRQFIKAFKENLKQGIPMGLAFLFCAYVVYLDFELYRVTQTMTTLVFGWIACVLFISVFLYSFALLARYENTIMGTMKNSLRITIRYFPRTIALVLFLALEILIFMFNSITLCFAVLIGPVCLMYTISGFAMYIFRRIEGEE